MPAASPIGNGGNVMFAGVNMTNTGNISLAAGSSLMMSLLGYYEAPNAGPTVFSNSGTMHMVRRRAAGADRRRIVPIRCHRQRGRRA